MLKTTDTQFIRDEFQQLSSPDCCSQSIYHHMGGSFDDRNYKTFNRSCTNGYMGRIEQFLKLLKETNDFNYSRRTWRIGRRKAIQWLEFANNYALKNGLQSIAPLPVPRHRLPAPTKEQQKLFNPSSIWIKMDDSWRILIHSIRFSAGVYCPLCSNRTFFKMSSGCYRYKCRGCQCKFDELTKTLFSNIKNPLQLWIAALKYYSPGANWSAFARDNKITQATASKMKRKIDALQPAAGATFDTLLHLSLNQPK